MSCHPDSATSDALVLDEPSDRVKHTVYVIWLAERNLRSPSLDHSSSALISKRIGPWTR